MINLIIAKHGTKENGRTELCIHNGKEYEVTVTIFGINVRDIEEDRDLNSDEYKLEDFFTRDGDFHLIPPAPYKGVVINNIK